MSEDSEENDLGFTAEELKEGLREAARDVARIMGNDPDEVDEMSAPDLGEMLENGQIEDPEDLDE